LEEKEEDGEKNACTSSAEVKTDSTEKKEEK